MKIFKMFALAAVVLFTVACGKDNNNAGTPGGNNSAARENTPDDGPKYTGQRSSPSFSYLNTSC